MREHFNTDTAIYVTIAMLAALQPFIADGSAPRWLGVPVAVVMAGLVAWKAKRSPGKEDPES